MRARIPMLAAVLLLAAGLAGCTSYDDGSYGGYGYGYDGRYGAGISYGYPGPYYRFGAYRYSYGFPYIVHRKRHFDGHRHRHFRPHRTERHDHDGRTRFDDEERTRFDDDGRRDRAAPRRDRDDGRNRDFERHRGRGADRDALRGSARSDRPDAGSPPLRVERRVPERRERHADRDGGRRAPARQNAGPPEHGADPVWSERRAGRFDGRRSSPSWPRGHRIWNSDG